MSTLLKTLYEKQICVYWVCVWSLFCISMIPTLETLLCYLYVPYLVFLLTRPGMHWSAQLNLEMQLNNTLNAKCMTVLSFILQLNDSHSWNSAMLPFCVFQFIVSSLTNSPMYMLIKPGNAFEQYLECQMRDCVEFILQLNDSYTWNSDMLPVCAFQFIFSFLISSPLLTHPRVCFDLHN